MAHRTCVGCSCELTRAVATREHILAQWLREELAMPGVRLNHYLRDENKSEDNLLRAHDLDNLVVKNVCRNCNGGWMSVLEDRAKTLILGLMDQKIGIMALTTPNRMILSRWAVKTAFMIASVQETRFDLPWRVFQNMRQNGENGPDGCLLFAAQQPELPNGFMYSCPSERLNPEGEVVQVKVGFSIRHLHLVVVIPILKAQRVIRIAAGIHTPLWPLDLEVFACFKSCPEGFDSPSKLLDFLINLIEVGILTDGLSQTPRILPSHPAWPAPDLLSKS